MEATRSDGNPAFGARPPLFAEQSGCCDNSRAKAYSFTLTWPSLALTTVVAWAALVSLPGCAEPRPLGVADATPAAENVPLAAGAVEAEIVFNRPSAQAKAPAGHAAAKDKTRPAAPAPEPASTTPASRPPVAVAPSAPPPAAPPPVAPPPVAPPPSPPAVRPAPSSPPVLVNLPSRPFAERGGVGIVAGKRIDGPIVVQKVVPDSPAAKAGIRPGDIVVRVGSFSLSNVESIEATRRLRGPPDSRVEIELQRPDGRHYTVTLVRIDWEKLYPGQAY